MDKKRENLDRFIWKPGDIEIIHRAKKDLSPEEEKALEAEKTKELRAKYKKGKP